MKLLKITILNTFAFCFAIFTSNCFAQEGSLAINQDNDIDRLIAIKKDMVTSEKTSDRYKIQIYSGARSGAERSRSKYNTTSNKWRSKLVYETPNYKVWVGSFRSRLEADKALKKIKEKFPEAFRFKPKKKKD